MAAVVIEGVDFETLVAGPTVVISGMELETLTSPPQVVIGGMDLQTFNNPSPTGPHTHYRLIGGAWVAQVADLL